jgi:hypothetical protein
MHYALEKDNMCKIYPSMIKLILNRDFDDVQDTNEG